ncbi:ATP-binding protein [Minwuia thermotolerans]|uniref:histidine kinase n=1 Tax=Minwuia thermotolerans TaxID=2056226 RepID=A0A2M9G0D1_9PROT|nr:ATP-binding protein [Minwuia thermotolerans]PJK29178.1 hypothetical protein CVT23_13415 [Minwuia thermotolerans]
MTIAIQEDAADNHRAEVLADVRRAIEAVEAARDNPAGRDRALRDLHTVKGAVGFLGLSELAGALHELEGVMGRGGDGLDVAHRVSEARRLLDSESDTGPPAATGLAGEGAFTQCLWWAERMIGQISTSLGKEAELSITGGDLRIDNKSRAALTRALQHLVRNAIVHGIETPDRRSALGKPRCGAIAIAVHRTGGLLTVEVSDDGAGLPDELSARVFQPGVSGAADVSLYAGRGIGLDVALSEVASLGGRVEARSTPGLGACFTIIVQEPTGP